MESIKELDYDFTMDIRHHVPAEKKKEFHVDDAHAQRRLNWFPRRIYAGKIKDPGQPKSHVAHLNYLSTSVDEVLPEFLGLDTCLTRLFIEGEWEYPKGGHE